MKDPSQIKVLVACEESQRVCMAFRERGFEAYSCDLLEPSGGHPEFHILGDALKALNVIHWDLLIAHPPCTYLSNAGARHLYKRIKGESYIDLNRFSKGLDAKDFFMRFYNADIKHIAIENPLPNTIFALPPYTQTIQPYEYGHPYTKRTCLWLKNLPPLKPTNIVEPIATWCPSGSYSHKHGEKHKGMFTTDRAKNRAKTFPGIAEAMAVQWGDYLLQEDNECQ